MDAKRRAEIESWLDTNWGCECWEGPSPDGPDINAFIRECLAEIDRLHMHLDAATDAADELPNPEQFRERVVYHLLPKLTGISRESLTSSSG